MLTQNQITLGISIILFIFSAINFWNARKGDIKQDTEGTLKANMKLDSLCASMTDTRVDLKGLVETTRKVSEKQIELDRDMKAAWARIDELKDATKENHEQIEQIIRKIHIYETKLQEGHV